MAPAPPECAIGRTSTVTGAPRAGMRKEQMMKEYYKIGEISKLYNIGTDSLRYYEEIGILRPRRDENGYRMYSVGDIRTLNVLRELRSIGFPMKDIKAHLKDFDVQQTLDMFAEDKIDVVVTERFFAEFEDVAFGQRLHGNALVCVFFA